MSGIFSACAVALFVCSVGTRVSADEARTYLGLWGNLFDSEKISKGLGDYKNSVFHKISGVLDGEEVRSKLLQRLATAEIVQHNVSHLSHHSRSSSHTSRVGDVAAQFRSLFDERNNNNKTSLLGCQHWATSVGSHMEHLCNEFTKLDYHQLIATAMLQGWALSSMLSKHSINISKLNKPSRAATAAEISLDTSGKGATCDRSFSPMACAGLQNFGGAEGFRFVYLGPPPCGNPVSVAANSFKWGKSSAFLLQCNPAVAEISPSALQGSSSAQETNGLDAAYDSTDKYQNDDRGIARDVQSSWSSSAEDAGVTAKGTRQLGSLLAQVLLDTEAGRNSAAQLFWGDDRPDLSSSSMGTFRADSSTREELANGGSLRSVCQLAVSTSPGDGAIMQYSDSDRTVLSATGRINAARIRVCNRAPYTLRETGAIRPFVDLSGSSNSTRITLRDLFVDGIPALQEPITTFHHSNSSGCFEQLFRLGGPGRPSVGQFTISGWLDIEEIERGSHGGFGVGDMASITITVGTYTAKQ